jgi:hypothetical protein
VAVAPIRQIKRRVYRGEEKWFPLLEEFGHRGLRSALIESGLSAQVAGGLVWFIDDQRSLDRHFNPVTGTRYRQILAELDPDEVARAIPGQFNPRHAA